MRRPPGREAYPGDIFYAHSPAARARGAPQRGERRRLADRAADHRDAGGRRVGLHPDQRDQHHRRPDLPADRPLQPGPAARGERRHQRQPGGRQRPDQGDAPGRRQAPPRPRPVPRAGGVRPVRVRPRQGDPRPADPRREAHRDPEAAAVRAGLRSSARWRSSGPRPTATSTTSTRRRSREFETGLYRFLDSAYAELLPAIAKEKALSDELSRAAEEGRHRVPAPGGIRQDG